MFQLLLVTSRGYLLKAIINTLLFPSIVRCSIAGSKRTSMDERVPTPSRSGPISRFHLYWSTGWYLGIALWRYIGIVWSVLGQAVVGIPKFLQQPRYNLPSHQKLAWIFNVVLASSGQVHMGWGKASDQTRDPPFHVRKCVHGRRQSAPHLHSMRCGPWPSRTMCVPSGGRFPSHSMRTGINATIASSEKPLILVQVS